MLREVEVVLHEEFLRGLTTGQLRLGVVRNKIPPFFEKRALIYEDLFSEPGGAANWKRLANFLSVLAALALLSTLILPFLISWRLAILSLVLAFIFDRIAYVCRREAVRQLVKTNPNAYAILQLRGIIVVSRD